MKRYIRSSQVPNSYLYIFKHGIGPGTIPRDIEVIRTKDLPNGYTAVWLNRFLTYDELKQYDIPSETRINELLGRIGYCQKNGDVIPCDDIDACDVTATSDTRADLPTFREFATTEWEVLNDGSKRLKLKDLFVYFGTDKQWNASDPGYWYEIKVGDKTYKESKKYSINNKERCYKAMQQAISKLLQSDDVGACDNVTASIRPHPPIPAGWERVPEGDDEEGNWSTISKELPNNGGYIWLDLYYDDNDRRYYELQIGYRNSDGTIGDIRPLVSKEFYRLGDAVKYAEDRINRESDSEDIESCDKVTASTYRYSAGRIEDDGTEDFYYDTGFDSYDEACDWGINHDCTHIYDRETDEFVPIESCDTKYFANMVSASNDPELDDDFLIEGYYDNQRRGLAESAETSDVSALNELANEYANKGYYIVVHNLTDGVITEFSADNWFNDIAPDGGAGLFMS